MTLEGGLPYAREAHGCFLATSTFGSLDGLRAASILAVVWHHTHPGFAGWAISHRGFLGVDLFFVISGFLIVTLLLRERRRAGAISLRRFYIRRFLRIFPAYYLMLALVGAIVVLRPAGGAAPAIRQDLPFALFYVANLFPMTSLLAITWSLAVEEQFYLVIPALERLAKRATPLLLAIAYVLVSLPPLGFFPGLALPSFFRETTFGPIILGVLLAHVLDEPDGYRLVARVLAPWYSPLAAVALVIVACSQPAQDISGWPRMLIHLTLLLLVAACVVRERHALARALSLWPLRRIGAVSYGIYLYHLLVRHGVERGMARWGNSAPLLLFGGTALSAWLVAELSYRIYESRFLALKARWG